jgi:hypothetical protein
MDETPVATNVLVQFVKKRNEKANNNGYEKKLIYYRRKNMNIKAQDISIIGEKLEKVYNDLPPKVKPVVVVMGAGAFFFFGMSEAVKSLNTFSKEGLPPMVENINKLKQGTSGVIIDEFCETQIVDDPSVA